MIEFQTISPVSEDSQIAQGARLKEIRKLLGLSQEAFGSSFKANIDKSTIAKYERGAMPVSNKLLVEDKKKVVQKGYRRDVYPGHEKFSTPR